MQTLRKKTSPCKYRNDPGRFFGDGVTFKAKLIGILEVGEARGDRMCQEALQDLKMAIRAAGEHKQRITIHVTIDGLRLRDEKTGDSLYHHPVHKISFIAQDMTDSRAFGYIFGSPDSGHRFFGIKTDKAASQVVLAMRDLFQVVFELKKKEIEMARQHIQSKTIHEHPPLPLTMKSTTNDTSNLSSLNKVLNESTKSNIKEMSPESVADLVDLEQELSSIQRGITQMERITPSEPTPSTKIPSEEDPFGDSFTNFPTYNILPPPPESTRSRHSKPLKITTDSINDQLSSTFKNLPTYSSTSKIANSLTSNQSDSWLDQNNVITQFETTSSSLTSSVTTVVGKKPQEIASNASLSSSTPAAITTQQQQQQQQQQQIEDSLNDQQHKINNEDLLSKIQNGTSVANQTQYIDAFSDLDPLGTGRSKPYVDKKYFFHELKNPPKKVLKELSGQQDDIFPAMFMGNETSNTEHIKDATEQNQQNIDSLNSTENKSSNFPASGSYSQSNYFPLNQLKSEHKEKPMNIDLERAKLEESMMRRDTDPFSPTRKKSDPFQDGDIFSKLDPFEFEFTNHHKNNGPTTDNPRIILDDTIRSRKDITSNMFNGPLQVSLPPEGWNSSTVIPTTTISTSTSPGQRKIERQTSESPTSISRNRPSVFKQNTVDVISSISSKKMPHLFGQKFSKRDSNSINMRRLQESDSLSENETAPEPPPRPDTSSHIEPPPLPPKKQFSDIIIRPRITSSSAIPPPSRYEYISSKIKPNNQLSMDSSAPPIPLPLRKVSRTDSTFPGPGRPRKPGEEEDYLTPITVSRSDVPPLLPPPRTRCRGRRSDHYAELKALTAPTTTTTIEHPLTIDHQAEGILPDITLSQLLTLGIDELAMKLNVPTSKLSTMTLVELTAYLSEFIENRKKVVNTTQQQQQKQQIEETPVFKVNFDQNSEAMFVAKFDDNFCEEQSIEIPFVANFSGLDIKPPEVHQTVSTKTTSSTTTSTTTTTIVPPADRYAVFREIIDQEMQQTNRKDSSEIDDEEEAITSDDSQLKQDNEQIKSISDDLNGATANESIVTPMQVPKIDTKITEVISHAKDRYAALRDIILVEDLFEKPVTRPIQIENFATKWDEENSDDKNLTENDINEATVTFEEEQLTKDFENESCSPEIEIKSDDNEEKFVGDLTEEQRKEHRTDITNEDDETIKETINQNGLPMHTLTVSSSNKDDIEIDELMNRAISNLSIDSRLSPNYSKSPTAPGTAGSVASIGENSISPTTFSNKQRTTPNQITTTLVKSQFNDVSTSPIPMQKSPAPQRSPLSKSPLAKSPNSKSPIPQLTAITNLIDASNGGGGGSKRASIQGSISDAVCGSSPEANSSATPDTKIKKTSPSINVNESWAVFDKEDDKKEEHKITSDDLKETGESPCSSDGKDWKGDQEYGKKWQRNHTSSSSRDLSPWDDETPDYKKRMPTGADRHGYYMRHARRMNSCDDDYEYEEEMLRRRDRRMKQPMSRSRENFDLDWYQSGGGRHNWSPPVGDEERRPFERSAYERSTYGPPYDKRHPSYDRRDYKNYEKRKYYREYARPDYEFDTYAESPDIKENRKVVYYADGAGTEKPKPRRDYENIYEEDTFIRDNRPYKSAREEYFYERGRRSFDRDSVESYESMNRRHKTFGSGDIYGSLDSREEFRERYLAGGSEKSRSLRKSMKIRGNEEYDQDSDQDIKIRRGQCDTRSLQRPTQSAGSGRIRKSSGSSPWDGEEGSAPQQTQKGWKRPSSASESERRLAENRRVLCHTLSGSDGEKDKRFRRKSRSRSVKEVESRQGNIVATSRYSTRDRDGNYDYIDDEYENPVDEDKFERLNRRRHEMHQRMIDIERRKRGGVGDKHISGGSGSGIYDRDAKYATYTPDHDRYVSKFDTFEDTKTPKPLRREYDFEDLDDTPRSNASSNKFNFEEHAGFESDFTSPPPPSGNTGSAATTTTRSFRFSNDFSEKEKLQSISTTGNGNSNTTGVDDGTSFEQEYQQTPTQKLRFDDKVTISKFENEKPTSTVTSANNIGAGNSSAFEDDFSQAEFLFENEDQWNTTEPLKRNHQPKLLTKRQQQQLQQQQQKQQQPENLKKSESVNIFARKSEDPFEDDDFFNISSSPTQHKQQHFREKKTNDNNNDATSFHQWDNNFAKFDENM